MNDDILKIVSDLTRETLSWNTIQCSIILKQRTFIKIGKNAPSSGEITLSFAAKPNGLQRNESFKETEQGRIYDLLECSNGTKCAMVSFDLHGRQKQVTITKTLYNESTTGYPSQPMPLAINSVGIVPLREAITRAEKIGEANVMSRKCSIYYFRDVPGFKTSDILYYLDLETSIPLKTEHYANFERMQAKSPMSSWEALSFDVVQGFHLAFNSRYTSYKGSDTNSPVIQLTNDYKISSIKFDEPINNNTFWPNYEKGVFINDLTARTSYYNTPDKKAPRPVNTDTVKSVEAPIIATPPPNWMPLASGLGVGMGILLVIIAIVVRIRK